MLKSKIFKILIGVFALIIAVGGVTMAVIFAIKNKKDNLYYTSNGEILYAISGKAGDELSEYLPNDKTGYTFGGWYLDREFQNKFISNVLPKGSTTLYAKWSPIKYTIKIVYDEGFNYSNTEKQIEYNSYLNLNSIPHSVGGEWGYEAVWYLGEDKLEDQTKYTPTSNVTLTLKKQPKTYDLVFHYNVKNKDNSLGEEKTYITQIKYGSTFEKAIEDATKTAAETSKGYKIVSCKDGYDDGANKIEVENASNVTLNENFITSNSIKSLDLYMEYATKTYDFTFTNHNGDESKNEEVLFNAKFENKDEELKGSITNLVANHYQLDGWSVLVNGQESNIKLNSLDDLTNLWALVENYDADEVISFTIKAKQTKEIYTVNFVYKPNANQSVVFASYQIEYQGNININDLLTKLSEENINTTLTTNEYNKNDPTYKLSSIKYSGNEISAKDTTLEGMLEELYNEIKDKDGIDASINIELDLEKLRFFIYYYINESDIDNGPSKSKTYREISKNSTTPLELPEFTSDDYGKVVKPDGYTAVFGGWLTKSGEYFDADYKLTEINNDINVYADIYYYKEGEWVTNNSGITGRNGSSDITNLYIPNVATSLGDGTNAISGVNGKRLLISSNITNINSNAFKDISCSIRFENVQDTTNYLTISSKAFGYTESSTSVTSIKLPARIQNTSSSIEDAAFLGTKNLTKFSIYNANYITDTLVASNECPKYFTYNNNLYSKYNDDYSLLTYLNNSATNFEIPSFVTQIADYAFYGAKSSDNNALKVTFGGTAIKKVGEEAFNSISFENIYLPNLQTLSNLSFHKAAVTGDVTLGSTNSPIETVNVNKNYNSVRLFGSSSNQLTINSFKYYTSISINFGLLEYVTISGDSEIKLIDNSNNLSIGGSLVSVFNQNAFNGTTTINAYEIKSNAFNSSSFKTLDLYASSLGEGSLVNLSATNLTIHNASVLNNIFNGQGVKNVIENLKFADDCSFTVLPTSFNVGYITNLTLNSICNTIQPLYGSNLASQLQSITFPNTEVSIKGLAFYNFSALKAIYLPNANSIGANAFKGCTKLEKVYIKAKTINCGTGQALDGSTNGLFSGCTNLKKVYLDVAETLEGNLFGKNCTSLKYFIITGNASKNVVIGDIPNVTTLLSNSTLTINSKAFDVATFENGIITYNSETVMDYSSIENFWSDISSNSNSNLEAV